MLLKRLNNDEAISRVSDIVPLESDRQELALEPDFVRPAAAFVRLRGCPR